MTKSKAKANDVSTDTRTSVGNKKQSGLASKKEGTKSMSEDNTSLLSFSEDVSTAEAPAPLPVGDYPAEIRGAERKMSAAGNPYGAVQFYIAPENYPADFVEGDPDGMVLTYNRVSVSDTPAGRHRLRKFLEAIGAKGGAEVNMNDWIGNTAVVSIEHDEYEGETRAVIKKVVQA